MLGFSVNAQNGVTVHLSKKGVQGWVSFFSVMLLLTGIYYVNEYRIVDAAKQGANSFSSVVAGSQKASSTSEWKPEFKSLKPYTVKKGDTLWGISGNSSSKVALIRNVNGIPEWQDKILPGTKLRIPE